MLPLATFAHEQRRLNTMASLLMSSTSVDDEIGSAVRKYVAPCKASGISCRSRELGRATAKREKAHERRHASIHIGNTSNFTCMKYERK